MRTRCPCCGASASLDLLIAHEDARDCLRTLFAIAAPLGKALVRYLTLFRPLQRDLSMARMDTVLTSLLPFIEAGTIPRKGRDWAVSPQDWCTAIDQMLLARDCAKLTLPLSGHGYLFEVLASLADKQERVQEQAQEVTLRNRGNGAAAGSVTYRGQAMSIGEGLEAAFGGRDPALAKLDNDALRTSPQPESIRKALAELRAKTLAQGATPTPIQEENPA